MEDTAQHDRLQSGLHVFATVELHGYGVAVTWELGSPECSV